MSGSCHTKRKIHLVNWHTIIQPRKFGGLQIRDVKLHNLALLTSLAWRFITLKNTTPWKSILLAKYHHQNTINLFVIPSKKPQHSFIWKGIIAEWSILSNYSKWAIGKGNNVRFWSDTWASSLNKTINQLLAGPFTLKDNHITISHFLNKGIWDFSELPYPLPIDLEGIIRDTITPTTPIASINNDTAFWTITPNGVFSTASCYNALLNVNSNADINLN